MLLLVTAGVFALIHLTPGDPIDAMMAESVDATVKETLRRELGLDQPIYVQYAAWMGALAPGRPRPLDPQPGAGGRERRPPHPPEPASSPRSPWPISLVIAFPLGIVSAARRNTPVDGAGTTFALFGICMPNFLLALLLIFLFGVTLRWLPISGYTDPFEEPLARPALAGVCPPSPSAWRWPR